MLLILSYVDITTESKQGELYMYEHLWSMHGPELLKFMQHIPIYIIFRQ